MGRHSWSDRKTVEECKSLDISWLRRRGFLSGYWNGSITWKNRLGEETESIGIEANIDRRLTGQNYIKLTYTQTDGSTDRKTDLDYKIKLDATPCYFGGYRYWFVCPLEVNGRYCGRRVQKLYLPPRSKYFGCRHCYNLTYTSCQEHDSRVSALMKYPFVDLQKALSSKNPRDSLLGIRAYFKMLDKLK